MSKRHWILCLALAACTKRHAIEDYPRDVVDPAPTLDAQIESVKRACAGLDRARFGVCEKGERAWVYFARSRFTGSQEIAYDANEGRRVFVEVRSWSDVCPAACLPDAVNVFGERPPCTPVMNDACGAMDGLKEWLEKR